MEARECIETLEKGDIHTDVADKACVCAGMILEMAGIPGGVARAREILSSGRAMGKFREIVAAQGGSPDISSSDMAIGGFSSDIVADRSGFVSSILNKAVVAVAKAAGAPSDHGAGVVIHRKRGAKVSKGDVILTVYAEKEEKLQHALSIAKSSEPVDVDGMLLERIGS